MNKLILNFKSKDSKKIKNPKYFLGGKGANLSEMGRMGLPVPPGFTISTKVCEVFYKDKKKLNSKLINQIKKELKVIEKDVSKKINAVKSLFDKTGASDASKALVIKYTQAAFEKLDILDTSDNNKIIFKTFGTNLMERKF
mgnify:CR=1 FL=1